MSRYTRYLKRPKVILTLLLVGLTLWIRLRLLGYGEMWWDQSITLNRSLEWVHGGPLPLSSMQSSFGVYNPPLVQYLYALPLFFKEDINGVVCLIAVVNLLGILAAGLATARVFNWRVAWWAMLLFAANPWAVYYGRLIWMQSFVPGFSAMLFACVLLYFADDPKPRYLVLAALCLSAVIQTHLTSVALLLALATIAGVCFRRVKLKPLIVGAGLFVLTFVPFLIFQWQTNFADWQTLQDGLQRPAGTNLAGVLLVLDLLHSKGIYGVLGESADLWRSLDLRWLRADDIITLVLAGGVISALISVANWRKESYRSVATGALILLLWLCLPLLAFVRHTEYLKNYYFLYIFPVPFVLMALLGDRLYVCVAQSIERYVWPGLRPAGLHPLTRVLALTAFLPLALIAFQQTRLDLIGQDLQAGGQTGQLRSIDVQRAIDVANTLMDQRPDCEFVVLREGPVYETSRFGLLREFVGRDCVRFVSFNVSSLYPYPCAVYFSQTTHRNTQAWLGQVAEPLPDYAVHSPAGTWTFHELTVAARAAAVDNLETDAPVGRWADDVRLNHFVSQVLPENDDQTSPVFLALTYTWEIGPDFQCDPVPATRPADSEDYMLSPEGRFTRRTHFGNYLLSEDGTLMSQFDSVGLDSREWHSGDIFQLSFQLPIPEDLPPGRYSLATARYFYPAVSRVPLDDGQDDLLILDWMVWPSTLP